MNLVWTAAAVADLEEIRMFIRTDNPERASSFVREILDAGESIMDMPRAFPLVPQLEHKHVRRRVFGRYLILSRIERECVEILHVAHSARDYVRALFDIL